MLRLHPIRILFILDASLFQFRILSVVLSSVVCDFGARVGRYDRLAATSDTIKSGHPKIYRSE